MQRYRKRNITSIIFYKYASKYSLILPTYTLHILIEVGYYLYSRRYYTYFFIYKNDRIDKDFKLF